MVSKRTASLLVCMAMLLNLLMPNMWMPAANAAVSGSPVFVDDFEGATTANLFKQEYMSLPDDPGKPMYLKTGGTVTADQGTLTIKDGRMTIGSLSKDPKTSPTETPNGVFDLGRPYQIIINVSSVDGEDTAKEFQVYADNNGTSAKGSIHLESSKVYSAAVSDIAGKKIVIESAVGTATSFIQIRTETGATVSIDSIAIVYAGDEDPTGPTNPPDPTTPLAPIVVALAGNEQVTLSWNAIKDADHYIVERSLTSGGPYDVIQTNEGSTAYVDSDVMNGTVYYYVITASIGGVGSDHSNEVSATPQEPGVQLPGPVFIDDFDRATQSNLFTAGYISLPNQPTKSMYISTSGASRTSVDEVNSTVKLGNARMAIGALSNTLTTTENTPGGVFDLSKPYQMIINFSSSSGTGNFQVFVDNNTSGTANSIHGASSEIYKKSADDIGAGKVIIDSAVGTANSFIQLWASSSAEVVIDSIAIVYVGDTDPTIPSLPTAPAGLQAVAGDEEVTLSWNPSKKASGFSVNYWTEDDQSDLKTDVLNTNTNSHTVTGLTNGQTVYFVVIEHNEAGSSDESNRVSAIPVEASIPAAPTGLTAMPGNGEVRLTWTPSIGATSYNVKRNLVGQTAEYVAIGVESSSFTDNNVTNDVEYVYVVSAVNKRGESVSSNTVNAIPAIPASVDEYNLTGFSYGATGGGNIAETDPSYIKVYTPEDLAEAINKKKGPNKNGYRVIEIMNDLNLGWNEISTEAKTAAGDIFRANNPALTHPVLMETGISKIELKDLHDVTIFSTNGAIIKHAGIVMKSSSNVIIRNLEFDELWEWDEVTKGDYDKNDWDFLTLEQSTKVWIDHCTFHKSYDGGIDIKKGSSGVTISWTLFQGDDGSADSWVTQQINALEQNIDSYTMYKFLRNQGLSVDDIIAIASGQKKQHLIGATSFDSLNPLLETTLHHNYYKDMMDRMPRLRGGNAHAYNIVMDSAAIREAGKRITPEQSAAISSKGYKFGVTSNGAISTEGGAVLIEKSHIIDLLYPIRNNQTDPNNPSYTGKIVAKDTIYSLDGVTFRGDSTTPDSPLAPIPAVPIEFSWSGMTELPYMYTTDDPGTLMDRLTANNGAGAGKLSWSKENWLITAGYDGAGDPGEVDPPPFGVAPLAPTNVTVTEGVNSIALKWKASVGATGYKVYRSTSSGSGYVEIGSSITASYTDSTAEYPNQYYYVISALTQVLESTTKSVEVIASPLAPLIAAPTGLSSRAGNSKVDLSWQPVTGAVSYNIMRSVSSGVGYTLLDHVNGIEYSDMTAINGKTYYYVIIALDEGQRESAQSVQVVGKPSGPITPPIIQEGDLIAAPNGQDNNLGTVDSPLSLTSAITKITSGGTIYLMDGIYSYSVPVTIERNNNGDAVDARKKIIAYNTGGAVLDFYGQSFDSMNRGLQIFGSYWLVKGIEVKGAGDNGIFIGGNYNVIENVETHHNRDSGLQISRYSSTALDSEWPSYNEIINVYSHDNFDPDNGEDADGFAAKLTIGPGNIFDGCIAAYNVDDGWDLFTKTATGPIGVVTIRNSISYANGKTSDGNETSNSDGNGYKLGGEKIAVNHIVENSIAFMNKKHGFTWNSNPGSITMSNNTSWSNGQSNFAFDQGTHIFTNNLSYKGKASDKTSGNDVQNTNVWWHNTKGSMNAKGLKADDSDFVSLIPTITRNADGSPNIGEFLKLAAMSDMKGAGTPIGMDIGAIFNTMEPDPEPDPGTDPKPDPGTDPKPDPGTDPKPDPGTDPKPDPGTDPKPDPGTDPKPDPGTDPKPDPGTDPGTNPPATSGNSGGSTSGTQPPVGGNLKQDTVRGVNIASTRTVEQRNGKTVDVNTVLPKTLSEAFITISGNQVNNQRIFIDAGSGSDSGATDFKLPLTAMLEGVKKAPDTVVSLRSGNVVYDLPLSAINLESLTKGLTDPSNAVLTVSFTRISGQSAEQLTAQSKLAGLTILTNPIEFTITVSDKGSNTEVNDFNSYVSRTIIMGTTDLSTDHMTAVSYDADKGEWVFVPAMITIVNGKVEVTIKRLSNSIYTIVEQHTTFNDIGGHWAKSEIELLASKLVIKGMTDTTYKPDNSMTRAEIASLLVRALGLKEQTTAQFTDVASNQWYAGAVGAAVKAGLVSGVGNGLFDPNVNITREEMVVMISRALHMADKDVAVDVPSLLKFNDHKEISHWAEEQVSQVLKAGIINGNTVNTFAPKDDVTRAEAAVMLQRFLKYVEFMN